MKPEYLVRTGCTTQVARNLDLARKAAESLLRREPLIDVKIYKLVEVLSVEISPPNVTRISEDD